MAFGSKVTPTTHETVGSELKSFAHMMTKLFGGPFSYSKAVDPELNIDSIPIGRTMTETILTNPTVISLAPGKCKYLSAFGSGNTNKNDFLTGLVASTFEEIDAGDLQGAADAFNSDKLFYTFETDHVRYMNRVNAVARIMALYLGIGDQEVPTEMVAGSRSYKYKEMDWTNWETKSPNPYEDDTGFSIGSDNGFFSNITYELENSLLSDSQYIHFFATTSSSYDESVSTSTRKSSIQTKFESSFDDTIKDVAYLMGDSVNQMGTDAIETIRGITEGLGADGIGTQGLLGYAESYISGSRLIFPEMPDDTSFGKSISVSTKFYSPYGDPESVFLHNFLPLAHVLAISYPQQVEGNMYKYPFLVKVYSKGWINSELAIVTGVRVQRGGQDDASWTNSGIATEIEVTMDVTPLITQMMIPTTSDPFNLSSNDGIIEYLGTLTGIDMKGDSVELKLETFKLILNAPTDLLRAAVDTILTENPISEFIRNITQLP